MSAKKVVLLTLLIAASVLALHGAARSDPRTLATGSGERARVQLAQATVPPSATTAVPAVVVELAESLPAVLPDAMVPAVALPEFDKKLPLTERVSRRFERLDLDKNGRISREEAAHARLLSRYFDVVDTNHDGEVSPAELRDAWKARMAARERARLVARSK